VAHVIEHEASAYGAGRTVTRGSLSSTRHARRTKRARAAAVAAISGSPRSVMAKRFCARRTTSAVRSAGM